MSHMQLFNNGISMNNHSSTPKPDTIDDTSSGTYNPEEVGVLNMVASLKGFEAFHQAMGQNLPANQWTLREEAQDFTQLVVGKEDSGIMNQIGKLFRGSQENGYIEDLLSKRNGRNGEQILQVVVSNSMDDVVNKTRDWSDFRLDRSGLQKASEMGNTPLYACVRLNVYVPEWSHHPTVKIAADKFALTCGHKVRLSINQLGYYVGEYDLGADPKVTIRIINLEQMKDSHKLVDIVSSPLLKDTSFIGFEFPGVKIPAQTAMNPLLGCTQSDKIIVGAQSDGFFQINKNTPCNLKVSSVAVATTRSCDPVVNLDGYYQFWSGARFRPQFNLLFAVYLNDRLSYYTIGKPQHFYNCND